MIVLPGGAAHVCKEIVSRPCHLKGRREEQILIAEKSSGATTTPDEKSELFESAFDEIMKSLDRQERFELLIDELPPYLEKRNCFAGDYLINREDLPSLHIEKEGSGRARLRCINGG